MSAPKGDWRVELAFAALILFIAVSAALLSMWIYCNR